MRYGWPDLLQHPAHDAAARHRVGVEDQFIGHATELLGYCSGTMTSIPSSIARRGESAIQCDELQLQAAADRRVQRIRCTEFKVEAAHVGIRNPAIVRVHIGSFSRTGPPVVEVSQPLRGLGGAQPLHPNEPRESRGDFGRSEVADRQLIWPVTEQALDGSGGRFLDEGRNQNAGVEIQVQVSSSSYIWLSSSTEVMPTPRRALVRANSHSCIPWSRPDVAAGAPGVAPRPACRGG